MRRLFSLVLCVLALPVLAQVPSAEQLEMLRNLTPEQRQMLLEQLGMGAEAAPRNGDKKPAEASEGPRAQGDKGASAELAEQVKRASTLQGEDTLVITIGFPEPRTAPSTQEGQPPIVIDPTKDWDPLRKEELGKTIERIRAKNPYRLNREGALLLPGFAPMPLAGLNEEQAALRLTAEPALDGLVIKVTRLPLERSGPTGLKPFGYELFKDSPSTFAPVTDVPVPADYVVGPGDELEVILYGNQNRTLRLTVGRDGRINFPELGPISVAGQRFSAVQAGIQDRVSSQMIGVRASVSMGDIRSVRVFVLGEANRPGTYTVSGLATITSAM